MNFALALLLVKRALGCFWVGHEWSEEWTDGEAFQHRVCRIAACQRHEVRMDGKWVATDVGRPGL